MAPRSQVVTVEQKKVAGLFVDARGVYSGLLPLYGVD
jgi:hypothetical protein